MINRTEIIERSINVETIISSLICHHFFPGDALRIDFMHILLGDPYANTGFKTSVLSKCYPRVTKALNNKINRLFAIRNIFAHCGLQVTMFADPDNPMVMDPKQFNAPLDFAALEQEFLAKEAEVLNELLQIMEEAGVKFLG